ncbi:hypothetical protein C4D60_Mb11t10360 [Musa balbisiana]|uniref:Uncharacterized protein n=1 Tax=Musa balbisiana TaxID=52838 RepID=A0A4S8J396_MUSBA|nr:hypothetical protein C4D60_Mb11t10360 [Musa balbisiana]
MATPVAGDGVLALMPQEVVNSIDPSPSPFNGLSEKSPILIFVYFQKAIRTELNRLHQDAVELATAGSGDVRFLAERCIFLFDIYQHHCNAEDVLHRDSFELMFSLKAHGNTQHTHASGYHDKGND